MVEKVKGTFKKFTNFGFLIPDNRNEYGGDFFINKKHFRNAEDGDRVTGHILAKSKGKKPEAKIVEVGSEMNHKPKMITGIYSEHKGSFGFVDVEGEEKGFFVFKKDNAGAKDGDSVNAVLKIFKGKKQAAITKILKNTSPLITGKFKDEGGFGFVIPDTGDSSTDIFVAGAKKRDAKTGDRVKVQIIKQGGRRPEGIIKEVM